MIRTENLTKMYDSVVAVKDLNLNVKEGEIYGFLGPNGAGKTTTILMLLGILKPTAGSIYLFDKKLGDDYFGIKKRIGVVSENQYLYEEMTASEYLNFFCDLYEVKSKRDRTADLLKRVDLYEVRNRRLGGFSRGMKQKAGIARALLHDPDLLIMDEPVSGLDPTGIKEVRDLVMEENKAGRTIFISSHILSEVEKICNRVGIINKAVLVAEDRMDNIKKRLTEEAILEIELDDLKPELVSSLSSLPFVHNLNTDENRMLVRTDIDRDYRADISKAITSQDSTIIGMKSLEMSLEEAFVTITQQNISLLTEATEGSEIN